MTFPAFPSSISVGCCSRKDGLFLIFSLLNLPLNFKNEILFWLCIERFCLRALPGWPFPFKRSGKYQKDAVSLISRWTSSCRVNKFWHPKEIRLNDSSLSDWLLHIKTGVLSVSVSNSKTEFQVETFNRLEVRKPIYHDKPNKKNSISLDFFPRFA